MQLIFTPALGSSTTLSVQPGSVVQFAARVSTRDYNEAVASGTQVELWGDLPNAGEWTATRFEPAPAAPEHFDEGIPSNVLSLLPTDPEPVPTTSAAPETTLLVASFVIPAHVETADYQFTYRLAHSNESSTWHTWLGDAGSNGHLIINQQAPPVEGLVFNDEKTAATLAGPVEWSGWALDLDSTAESPATPRRFSALPKALSATHIALFPIPGLTTLNPASHVPVLLSSSAPLSLDDRNLTAHGAPINVAPLSRAAVESSLPDHAVLLAESATTPPFVIVHDTRGAVLSILPAGTTSPGTQIISLDLDQAKVAADAPAKSLLFSPSANKAAFYAPGTRVAVPALGADVLVQETYTLGDKGAWEVGVAGGTKVNGPESEPEVAQPVVQSVPEPTKLAPPPIQTTRPTVPELDTPVSPETPADARLDTPPSKRPELETVSESEEHEPQPALSLSPRPHSSTASLTPAEQKNGVLAILQGVAAVVMCYVSRAWSMFGLGFRMFGIGVRVPTAKAEEAPAVVVTPAEAPVAPTHTDAAPAQKSPAPATDESESDSETGSLNEVAPTPIDPKHTIPVAVVDPATHSTPRRSNVDMPLTPPMSPKAATSHVPFAIPTEPKPAPKPKLTFTSPEKSTLFVVGPSTDELEVKIGGVRIPTSWDRVEGPGEASTWVLEVEVGKGPVEVAVA